MKLRRSSTVFVFLCAMLAVILPLKVYAHAVLVESRPPVGAVVKGPVIPLWLRFNVRVDGSRSRCTLVLPDGSTKPLVLDLQSKPDVITGRVTASLAGDYKLRWQVLAADGHITRGEFVLKVK
jgi:copper resistance protein C